MMKNELHIGGVLMNGPGRLSALERIALVLTRLIGVPCVVERVLDGTNAR
jgi:hypothetical protein